MTGGLSEPMRTVAGGNVRLRNGAQRVTLAVTIGLYIIGLTCVGGGTAMFLLIPSGILWIGATAITVTGYSVFFYLSGAMRAWWLALLPVICSVILLTLHLLRVT